MKNGVCKLCGLYRELKMSHIFPAFVFRWLKQSSGNGHIRSSIEPNKRIQDGLKRRWLCNQCEGVLNRSETLFATNLFHPYTENSSTRVKYQHWLIEFSISISWRVLHFLRDEKRLQEFEHDALSKVDEAEVIWREVLLSKRPHPGGFRQHMLPLDEVESTSGALHPNINRYFMRAIDMDICRVGSSIFTFAKLGRFVFIGFVSEEQSGQWQGTKIHATEGVVEPRKYILPRYLGDYMNERAAKISSLFEGITQQQQIKIDDAFSKNIDSFIGSDAYCAMLADLSMFGDNAFTKNEK